MIHFSEERKGSRHPEFSAMVLEAPQHLISGGLAADPGPTSGPGELQLSGSHPVAGSVSGLSAVSLLGWAFLKFWLFEQ